MHNGTFVWDKQRCLPGMLLNHKTMNRTILILLTFILLACERAEIDSADNRLYMHVDTLITEVLHYAYNEDSYRKPFDGRTTASRQANRACLTYSLAPLNPEPLIVLDGEVIAKEELRNYSMDSIQGIDWVESGVYAVAIYGEGGKNGVVIITTVGFEEKS